MYFRNIGPSYVLPLGCQISRPVSHSQNVKSSTRVPKSPDPTSLRAMVGSFRAFFDSLKVLEPLQRREDDLSSPPPHGARVLGTSAACVLIQRSASSLRFLLQGSASPPHILIQGYKSKDFLRWECNVAPWTLWSVPRPIPHDG
jgi:hypothetical protein